MSAGQGWGEWLGSGAVWTSVGAVLTFGGRALWNMLARRDTLDERRDAREDRMQRHNSALAIELLQITKSEAESLRRQLGELQGQLGTLPELERRLAYFEESLLHIGNLLEPDKNGGREATENAARVFLAKMVSLRLIKGAAANAEQVKRAAQKLIGDDK